MADTSSQLTATILLPAFARSPAGDTIGVTFTLPGDWRVGVRVDDARSLPALRDRDVSLDIVPAEVLTVVDENCGDLPVYNPRAGGWARGYRPLPLRTQETIAAGLLDPASFVLRDGVDKNARTLKQGIDYDADLAWGTFGRPEAVSAEQARPVYASYRHGTTRLDSILVTADGRIAYRRGVSHVAVPAPPPLANGEMRLANLYVAGRIERLSFDHIFAVHEAAYPEPQRREPAPAATLLPRTLAKLTSGEPLRILAWGDSVTEATYLPNPATERWQAQLVARLSQRFPKAKIELITEAWGGRNTDSYLNEPPGSLHNYKEKVLDARPDVVISEFVNDGGFTAEKTASQYTRLLADFRAIGAEWIILTPHYVKPDWMGLTRQCFVDADPRAYVQALRTFAPAHGVALADASLRWGRLWRQGVPYMTLQLNAINHPNADGMRLFVDAVMALF